MRGVRDVSFHYNVAIRDAAIKQIRIIRVASSILKGSKEEKGGILKSCGGRDKEGEGCQEEYCGKKQEKMHKGRSGQYLRGII